MQLEIASWALNEEDFPLASEAIRKVETQGDETIFSRNLKAKIAFAKQSYAIAESHYQAILQREPANFDAANMLALCMVESSDSEKQKKALEISTRNFRSIPDNLVAQASLGYIHFKLGEFEKAKAFLTTAAKTPGTSPEVEYFVASCLRQFGQKEAAREIVGKALDKKGLFLYRAPAKKLLAELGGSTLPKPAPSGN